MINSILCMFEKRKLEKMNNNLITTNQNAKLVLSKSKSLLNIINSLLSNKEDKWIERLWKWANENKIPDPDAEKGRWFDDKNEKWGKGIPREKTRLLNLQELDLSGALFNPNEIKELPNEIIYLSNVKVLNVHKQKLSKLPTNISKLKKLESLWLSNNPLEKLPEEICNFKELKYLSLSDCKLLILSEKQKAWICDLINNDCIVYTDDDLFSRVIPEIEIDENEIPF